MDFVCKVVGDLIIPDLKLKMTHMELVSLDTEDFKSSPRLREALRNKEIESFDPARHSTAKRIKVRTPKTQTTILSSPKPKDSVPVFSDLSILRDSLSNISGKMLLILNKMDNLVLQVGKSLDVVSEKLDKIAEKEIQQDNKKIDTLIDRLNELLDKEVIFSPRGNGRRYKESQENYKEDLFIPKLDTQDVVEKKIKAQEIVSEGTDDILEKLKNMNK